MPCRFAALVWNATLRVKKTLLSERNAYHELKES